MSHRLSKATVNTVAKTEQEIINILASQENDWRQVFITLTAGISIGGYFVSGYTKFFFPLVQVGANTSGIGILADGANQKVYIISRIYSTQKLKVNQIL